MDVVGWLWWIILKAISLVWSLVWFLLGGWVATLAQLVIILGVIFSYKYGWRRAPVEIVQRARTFGGFVWAWMRAKDYVPVANSTAARGEIRVRTVRSKEVGDINLSTLLSIATLLGLGLIAVS
jgi:hypothetical protein